MKKELLLPVWIKKTRLETVLVKSGVYLALLLLLGAAALISPVFYRPANVFSVLEQASALGIVSIGQTLVILAGGIDFSVASVMATVNVVAASQMLGRNEMVIPVSLLCLALGGSVGLINSGLITKLKIPPFVATLGMMIVIRGARFLYTKGAPYGSIPPHLRFIGTGEIGGLPVSVIVFAVFSAVAIFLLRKTALGRRIYSVGGNPAAAHLSGTRVNWVVTITYVICGLLAAVAGLTLTGYLGFADNWAGKGYELDSIAAVVVGGTSLGGGRGSVVGTVAGVLIITVIFNLVLILNLPIQSQLIVKGSVIIGAVALYFYRRR